MRARAWLSQGSNGGLWDLIVLSNWTSVTVTLTAAVIRVCLALQMGVLTGMIASLLIEKSGVPMDSAPFVSILRAVSASPYHLVSRAALTTPFAIAVGLGVLLTGASQFPSTALLFDFGLANITTPKQTVVLPYGSSQPENPSVDGLNSPNGNYLATHSAEKLNWTSSDGLPYMSLNGDQRAGGILVPGAFSPYAVHYEHAALFQDIAMTTGSLAQGLQGLFTVLRQMAYYEISPYFDMQSPASLILSNEELIP
ncbi:hypothetical protein QIS74_07394 [Colletotrichum tabaci]|uniref:Uncharacterized protein n=1 Tax=Colletotrichum tabaci TaxID=1209068 RepID=A0AAV9TB63_9PEZI